MPISQTGNWDLDLDLYFAQVHQLVLVRDWIWTQVHLSSSIMLISKNYELSVPTNEPFVPDNGNKMIFFSHNWENAITNSSAFLLQVNLFS